MPEHDGAGFLDFLEGPGQRFCRLRVERSAEGQDSYNFIEALHKTIPIIFWVTVLLKAERGANADFFCIQHLHMHM
ncbi:hypothetical protein D3C80_2150000 [compost metagenome]